MDTLELLLHPVRMRLVHAMAGGRTYTTSELCARLPDVSKATVYRHVGVLVDEGVLEVESEQHVRGAIERSLRLHRPRAVIDRDTAASMTLDDHRAAFAAALAVLAAEFNAYLDRGNADPFADLVGYRQIPLWLNRRELTEVLREIGKIVAANIGNGPTPSRGLYLLSPILFPNEDGEPAQA